MVFSTEKSFLEVAPRPLLLDGSSNGVLSVVGACQLKVGQKFILKSNTQPPLLVKINQFIDDLSFYVGAHNKGVNDRIDVSAYLVADSADIFANKQPRPSIPPDDVIRSVYSEEPAMALRNLLVDECGLPHNKDNPVDVTVHDPNLSVFGDQVVASRTHEVSAAFNYNISDRVVTTITSGTGTAIYDQNTLKTSVGTGVGSVTVQSNDTVTYRPGSEGFAMFTASFEDGGEIGLEQGIGLADIDNGFFLGYNGTSFGVAHRKATVDVWTESTAFNGEDISWLDVTKFNIYMIRYGWLGIAPITYYVYHGPTRSWVLMHSTDLTNKQALPHINTPNLPICTYQTRVSGTGTATTMRTSSWRGGIVDGTGEDFHRHFTFGNDKEGITNTLTNIFTIRNKTTYQSVTNRVPIEIELISFSSDGTKAVEISIWENATLGGTPVWNDINTDNSVSEYDTAGTTVTGGERLFITYLTKIDRDTIDLLKYRYKLNPGKTWTFAAKTISGTSDISYAANWGEIF